MRAELDDRTESVGRKIRDAELRKIPYMLVVGDREAEQDEVSVREHRGGDTGAVSVAGLRPAGARGDENPLDGAEIAAILAPVDPTSHHTARPRLTQTAAARS